MTLGDIVKNYRLENNYSMDDFSKISGLSKGYISMLEKNKNPRNGKPISPSLATIKQISIALNIDFDDLIKMIDSEQTVNLSKSHLDDQSDVENTTNTEDLNKLPQNIRAAARNMANLPEEHQKTAIDIIEYLIKKGREAKK